MASGSRDKRVLPIFEVWARQRPARASAALSALLLGVSPVGCSDAPRPAGPGTSVGNTGAASTGGSAAGGLPGSGGTGFGAAPTDGAAAGGTFIDPGIPACSPVSEEMPFRLQVLANQNPVQRVLYSWTVPEQLEELRRDRKLFVRSEQAGMGRGYAFTAIASIASMSDANGQALGELLAGSLFEKIRYAWPNPWATRRGFPGEDYGNQLLRIVLKESAWTVLVQNGAFAVRDMAGANVPISMVLATPERIGAIFFVKDQALGGGGCTGTFDVTAGGATYREFILGNEAMIEEWSLGTEEIRQRLVADINDLSLFLEALRACSESPLSLGAEAGCLWSRGRSTTSALVASYIGALSMASEYYVPRSAEVAALIDILEGDLFEPDPLLVRPGE